MCILYACSTHRGQKGASDRLELELQAAVSHRVGGGNRTQVFYNSSQCSQPLTSLLPQILVISIIFTIK